jgi:hypothetical protein
MTIRGDGDDGEGTEMTTEAPHPFFVIRDLIRDP